MGHPEGAASAAVSIAYPLQFLYWAVTTTGIAAAFVTAALALWQRPRRGEDGGGELPPITVLKPFDGVDPELEANFWSYLAAPYPAPRQVLFCTAADNDDGIAAARSALQRLEREPRDGVEAELLLSRDGEVPPSNRKTWHLQRGLKRARHPVIVSGDSGTRLEDDTLTVLVRTLLAGPRRGIVWSAYTADPGGGSGARLTRLAVSASALSFFVIAAMHRLLRRPPFVAGALFAMRRDALGRIGGFKPYADVLAEDLDIARNLVAHGWEVVMSPRSVVQIPGPGGLAVFFRRMVRWNVIMWRYRDPLRVHYPMVLTSIPLALLTLPGAALAYPEQWPQFAILLGALLAARVGLAVVLRVVVHRRRPSLDLLWALPLLEAVLLAAYVRALFVRTLRWRAQELMVHDGGRMERR